MKSTLCSFIFCLLFALTVRAETPTPVPAFHIEPGDVLSAQVRLYSTAAPELYVLLKGKKSDSLEAFIRQNIGRKINIYVCGEVLSDDALPADFDTSEIIFLVSPQNALDLAQKLMKKTHSPSARR